MYRAVLQDRARRISIHALLAESDYAAYENYEETKKFLSTLSLRRATQQAAHAGAGVEHFYPRSPCGERLIDNDPDNVPEGFLSTLSLRRATPSKINTRNNTVHFYPRSPCGERPVPEGSTIEFEVISIHALLAESDHADRYGRYCTYRFLSTLSLRRATRDGVTVRAGVRFLSTLSLRRATTKIAAQCTAIHYFYPRSPCGERRRK